MPRCRLADWLGSKDFGSEKVPRSKDFEVSDASLKQIWAIKHKLSKKSTDFIWFMMGIATFLVKMTLKYLFFRLRRKCRKFDANLVPGYDFWRKKGALGKSKVFYENYKKLCRPPPTSHIMSEYRAPLGLCRIAESFLCRLEILRYLWAQ